MAAFSYHSLNAPPQGWVRSKPFFTFATLAGLAFLILLVSFYPSDSIASVSSHSRDFLKEHLNVEQIEKLLHHDEVADFEEQEPQRVNMPTAQPEQGETQLSTRPDNAEPAAVTIPQLTSKYAFATFLSGSDHEIKYEDDHYFIATRILVWQLLHSKATKSRTDVPVIVIVADRVPEQQRQRLRQDGATVVQVPSVSANWTKAGWDGWDGVLTKLRLYEFTQFERIAFLDVDTILAEPVDDMFQDPAVAERTTLPDASRRIAGAIGEPASYVFAGNAESAHGHHFPPTAAGHDFPNVDYLNAGFFVIKPDVHMLNYYLSVLNTPGSFDSELPEQNLMNEVHSRARNMPWQQISYMYNVHYPNMTDVEAGVKMVHEKWWSDGAGRLRFWMRARRWAMEGYYEAMDEVAERTKSQGIGS